MEINRKGRVRTGNMSSSAGFIPPALAGAVAGVLRPVAPRGDLGRNDPCLCGSGKKRKKCCLMQKAIIVPSFALKTQ